MNIRKIIYLLLSNKLFFKKFVLFLYNVEEEIVLEEVEEALDFVPDVEESFEEFGVHFLFAFGFHALEGLEGLPLEFDEVDAVPDAETEGEYFHVPGHLDVVENRFEDFGEVVEFQADGDLE